MTLDAANAGAISDDGQWQWDGVHWAPRAVVAPPPPPITRPQTSLAGTSGLAIASLVLGLVWLAGLGSILAIVLGAVALSQIKKTKQGGKGIAIAGMILGVVGLLPAMLVLITFSAGNQVNSDFQDTCRQIGGPDADCG